jgi:hypothetical protein
MTREEAIFKICGVSEFYNSELDEFEKIINEIYDHFEAIDKQNIEDGFNGMSCESCKYGNLFDGLGYNCMKMVGVNIKNKDFCCNKWERISNE